MDRPKPNHHGMIELLTTLAGKGDNWVKLGTLVLIGLTGLGNWMTTWNVGDRNKTEIEISRKLNQESQDRLREEVRQQVADIHRWMREATEEFHKGNDDSAANRKMLEDLTKEKH
jgi:hypothetical protein